MEKRKIEPRTALGVLCVLVGIVLVFFLTTDRSSSESLDGDTSSDVARGQQGGLLDPVDGAPLPAGSPEVLIESSLRAGLVTIPEGQRGVTVRVDFIAGVGGYAAPGDRVDIYATVDDVGNAVVAQENESAIASDDAASDAPAEDQQPAAPRPRTVLVLENVEVLDVSRQVAPLIDGAIEGEARLEAATLTYLLLVDQDDVDEVIFNARRADIYLALTPDQTDDVDADATQDPDQGEN